MLKYAFCAALGLALALPCPPAAASSFSFGRTSSKSSSHSKKSKTYKRYLNRDTRLLKRASSFGQSLGDLHKAQRVEVLREYKAYALVRVKPAKGQKLKATVGWVHQRTLVSSRPKVGSSSARTSSVSSTEVAAATKGFNKQIEAEYKGKNAGLDYAMVDKLEDRTPAVSESTLKKFRQAGKLGEFAPEAKEAPGVPLDQSVSEKSEALDGGLDDE